MFLGNSRVKRKYLLFSSKFLFSKLWKLERTYEQWLDQIVLFFILISPVNIITSHLTCMFFNYYYHFSTFFKVDIDVNLFCWIIDMHFVSLNMKHVKMTLCNNKYMIFLEDCLTFYIVKQICTEIYFFMYRRHNFYIQSPQH